MLTAAVLLLSLHEVFAVDASLIQLDQATYPVARCLDGSPYGIYFRAAANGANSNKFIIHFQGGGFCTALDIPSLGTTSCADRANTDLGSSLKWPPTACGKSGSGGSFGVSSGGILSDDPTINPYAFDYNLAFFGYCSGDAFTGNQPEPLNVTQRNANGAQVWLRGAANMDAALDYLIKNKGMGKADLVIVSGCSAGGTSVYLHLDHVAAALPGVTVKGLADAGFVLNLEGENGKNYTHDRFFNGSQLWAPPGGLSSNAACTAAHSGATDAWMCLAPQYVYPFITTPVFILAAEYDEGLAGGKSFSGAAALSIDM